MINSKMIWFQPKFLWFLVLAYSMIIILSNWFYPRSMMIFGLNINAGMLLTTPAFFISALITEVYGYQHMRQTIWCACLFNVLLIVYAHIVVHMPNPTYPTNNSQFDTLLTPNLKFFCASTVSYFGSQPVNAWLIAKLKKDAIHFRFLSATLISIGTGHIIFNLFFLNGKIISPTLFINFLLLLLGTPTFIYLAKKLKQIEKLDIYDTKINFNLFSLKAEYGINDNKFTTGKN